MANIVSITVQAKDRAKPVFKDVSGAAEKTVSRLADSSRGIIGRAAGAARSLFSNVVTGLSDMGDAIVSKVGTALKIGMAGVGVAAGAALFGGIRRLLNIEDAIHGLQQMGLSGKQTRKLMDDLDKTMRGMTFTLDAGATAIKRLITAGSPLDDVNRRFRLMADAAAFGKAPLEELTNIFERIVTEGKLTGETLNMLHVRGVPALKLLASAAGTTEEELREMLSSGEVGAEKFFDLWEKGAKGFGEANVRMEGAAKSMDQTTRGAFQNMLTSFSRVAARIAGPVFSQMKDVFNGIRERVEAAEPAIQAFADRFSEVAENIIRTKVIPALQRVGEVFKNVIIPAFQAMIEWVQENQDTIQKWLKAVLPAIGIVTALSVAISLIKDAFILLTRFTPIGIITALIAALIFAWQNSERFRDIVTNAFETVRGAIERVWEFVSNNLIPVWQRVGEIILPILKDLIEAGFKPLKAAWKAIATVIKEVVLPALGAAFDFFMENILPVLLRVGEFIRDKVIPAFIDFRDSVFEHIITPLQSAWEEFREKYLPIIEKAAEETREKLMEAWKELKKLWNEQLKPALDSLRETFEEDVLPALKKVWKEIDGPLLDVLKTLGALIAGAVFVAIIGFLTLLARWAEGLANVIRGVRRLLDWWNRLRRAASRIVKRVRIPGGKAIRRLLQRILGLWNALRRIGGIVLNVSAPGLGGLLDQLSRIPSWVPGFASGGIGSGLAVVGERGREIVDLGASSRVINNDETERILSGQAGSKLALELDWKPGFEGRITDAIMENLLFRIRTSTALQDALKLSRGRVT